MQTPAARLSRATLARSVLVLCLGLALLGAADSARGSHAGVLATDAGYTELDWVGNTMSFVLGCEAKDHQLSLFDSFAVVAGPHSVGGSAGGMAGEIPSRTGRWVRVGEHSYVVVERSESPYPYAGFYYIHDVTVSNPVLPLPPFRVAWATWGSEADCTLTHSGVPRPIVPLSGSAGSFFGPSDLGLVAAQADNVSVSISGTLARAVSDDIMGIIDLGMAMAWAGFPTAAATSSVVPHEGTPRICEPHLFQCAFAYQQPGAIHVVTPATPAIDGEAPAVWLIDLPDNAASEN